MCWSVYNDFDPDQHANDAGSTAPLGLTVEQTVFAFERKSGSLANTVFLRFQVYNRGIRRCRTASSLSGPILTWAMLAMTCCTDTLRNLAYTYNSTDDDANYDAIHKDVRQSAWTFSRVRCDTPVTSMTRRRCGGSGGRIRTAGIVFVQQIYQWNRPGQLPADLSVHARLDAKTTGAPPYINPTTSEVTRFVMSGTLRRTTARARAGWMPLR